MFRLPQPNLALPFDHLEDLQPGRVLLPMKYVHNILG
jgi:hypothetical protein